MTVLALENLGIEPTRDQIRLITLGDQSVAAKSFIAGKIDGTYLSYGYRPVLKEVKHRILLDLGRSSIPYQGLSLVAQRAYLRRNPRQIDALLHRVTESIAFVRNPSNKDEVLKSLRRNLRFKNTEQAFTAYEALQGLYGFDMKPSLSGIENVARLHSVSNPRMAKLTARDVVESEPLPRLETSIVYRKFVNSGQAFINVIRSGDLFVG
jgi:hypothetical protein